MKSILMLIALVLITVSAVNAEDLIIVGTGSSANILESLGQAFFAINPEITVIVPPSIGSGGGIKAVGNDDFLVGRIARSLSAKEQRHGLTVLRIARVPIVFFVNSSVSLKNISSEQVCNVYAGKTRKWEDLGGEPGYN